MKNVVIITAKGSNTTVQNKNVIPIMGVPVVCYPVRAAKLSSKTDGVFMSTECGMIKTIAHREGIAVIDRPAELATPESQHRDVIRHAVLELEKLHPDLENVIVLLGNTVMVTPGLIDRAFNLLESGTCDSCASVWKAQDDHPYRALKLSDDGFLQSFSDVKAGSNRQSYPTVYFYDQGVWGFKKHCAIEQKGPSPWVWLGERCRMIERLWVTGRDIHTWIDVAASAWYLNSIQANDFQDYSDD
jgi:CMP-N-acetylneuraminic acid synthetase